jgi:transposase
MHTHFCGIDISKDGFHAALIDALGRRLWSRAFPMSLAGFRDLLQALSPASTLIGLESTGVYGLNLFCHLHERGCDVRILNPLLVSNFAKLSLRQTKTDKRDATTIAEFLKQSASTLPPSPPAHDGLRALARERESLSSQIVAAKNEIKRLLHVLFPESLQLLNPFAVSSLQLFAAYPSKDAIAQAPSEALRKIWSGGHGRKPTLALSRLLDASRSSVGIASPAYESIFRSKIRILLTLNEELNRVTDLLIHECRHSAPQEMSLLASIDGLGDVTTAHFVAETHGRIFSDSKKLIAFAGLDPIIRESGQWKGKGRISKRGSRSLRKLLFLMSTLVVRNNPVFRELYDRKRAEGKRYRQAVLAVAHKLIRVIHSMLRYQRPFNPINQYS